MELAAPGFIYTVFNFLLLLTVLVFIHEWGHFSVARYFGVKVDVFSIGFGRELFGWNDKKGTRWKICILPFGGYVKFFGDANEASGVAEGLDEMSDEDKAVSFHHKPLAQRAAIVAAGPLVNFAFAILVFAGLFMTMGEPFSSSKISAISENSAAYEAGLMAGDEIVAVDGVEINRFSELQSIVSLNTGSELALEVAREGQVLDIFLTPKKTTLEDRFGNNFVVYRIGIQSGPVEIAELGFFQSIVRSVEHTGEITKMMLVSVGQMITGLRSLDEMGGPLKIAQFTGQSASLGIISFISFMALISINLGLVNLFPIPMLDGGHLMFYGIEAVKGSPVNEKVQEYSYLIGFVFVISLMVLLTWNDLGQFKVWESIGNFFTN
jgi:regulator of sigma E protease